MGLLDQKRFTQFCAASDGTEPIEHFQQEFREFLRKPGMAEILNEELRPLTRNHRHDIFGGDTSRIVLWSNDHYALHVQYHLAPTDALYGITSDGLVGIVGPAPLHVRRYRVPPGHRNDVFDSSCILEFEREETVAPGEVVVCHRDRESIDFVIEGPVVLLKFFSTRISSLLWSFDRTTLRATNVFSAELEPSIITYMTQLLGAMADNSSVAALRHLCSHDRHFVRWDAISQLCSVDPAAALQELTKALEDPHPHVRNAAKRTLAGLQKPHSSTENTGDVHGDYARV